jgi:hypothetical protein
VPPQQNPQGDVGVPETPRTVLTCCFTHDELRDDSLMSPQLIYLLGRDWTLWSSTFAAAGPTPTLAHSSIISVSSRRSLSTRLGIGLIGVSVAQVAAPCERCYANWT